jgi:formylglycine-generating enzyme required for sulfatase activity
MKQVKTIIVLIFLSILISCPDYNNPVDPAAVDYEGFYTVEHVDDVGLSFENGEEFVFLSINVSKCINADIYQLQISSSASDFSSPVFDFESTDYKMDISGSDLTSGTWYARARAMETAGSYGTWSEVVSFDADMPVGETTPFRSGSTDDLTPLIDWEDVADAASYEIRYASTGPGLVSALSNVVTASQFQHPSTSLSYGDFVYWQVKAFDVSGIASVWSSAQSFILIDHVVDMVPVAGGTFVMGDTWDSNLPYSLPVHNVTLSGFSIGKYEVSFSEWKAVYDWALLNGYTFQNPGNAGNDGIIWGDTNDEPVTLVTWMDIIVWCNAASEMIGLIPVNLYEGSVIRNSLNTNGIPYEDVECDWAENGYRLPSEAEWEYAAKGGNKDTNSGKYAGSSTIGDVAWYLGNSEDDTHPVGEKQANELELYDMSGNVFEWVWDWIGPYSSEDQTDPHGPSTGTLKPERGGSWRDDLICNVAYRGEMDFSITHPFMGFRLASSY